VPGLAPVSFGDSTITGPGSLTVVGQGSLVLSGANNYLGGTDLNGGVVAVANDANLGTGPLTFNGGTLEALTGGGGITSSKINTINGGGGTFLADPTTISVLSGPITGPGLLRVTGQGSLVLTGLNDYGGGTDLAGGVLAVQSDSNLGTGPLIFDGRNTGSNRGKYLFWGNHY
jgi:fibronectin-binding autotransporter adhesin